MMDPLAGLAWLMNLPFASQIAGAVAGGLVGGFAGFLTNRLMEQRSRTRMRSSVAAALAGEVEALSAYLGQRYLPELRADLEAARAGRSYYHRFRAERDYGPVFHSLGINIGLLPEPLPCDLAGWYTAHNICLERARELHELFCGARQAARVHALEVGDAQCAAVTELIADAGPLVAKLRQV